MKTTITRPKERTQTLCRSASSTSTSTLLSFLLLLLSLLLSSLLIWNVTFLVCCDIGDDAITTKQNERQTKKEKNNHKNDADIFFSFSFIIRDHVICFHFFHFLVFSITKA